MFVEYEVVLEPGDILYHPAGIWHRVECLEDSIAINLSLMVTSYADLLCCGLLQMLMQNPSWRAPVQVHRPNGIGNEELKDQKHSEDTINNMIQAIPQLLAMLTPRSFLVPGVSAASNDESSEMVSDHSEDKMSSGSNMSEEGSQQASMIEEEEEKNASLVILARDIDVMDYFEHRMRREPIQERSAGTTSKTIEPSKNQAIHEMYHLSFQFNPLATILDGSELNRLGRWTAESIGIPLRSDQSNVAIVHVAYGNENYESVSRIAVVIEDQSKDQGESASDRKTDKPSKRKRSQRSDEGLLVYDPIR